MKTRIPRRTFLRGLGGVSVAAPFLSSVWERQAKGQTTAKPKQFIAMFSHYGCVTTKWFPAKSHGALAASDLMVFASRTEGMPASLIEAGMAGLPVAATTLPGVPEVVVHGTTAGDVVETGAEEERDIPIAIEGARAPITAVFAPSEEPAPGDRMRLGVAPDKVYLFDLQSGAAVDG